MTERKPKNCGNSGGKETTKNSRQTNKRNRENFSKKGKGYGIKGKTTILFFGWKRKSNERLSKGKKKVEVMQVRIYMQNEYMTCVTR